MEHKLYARLITKDGHNAEVHRKRNALLMFRYRFYVTILSKYRHHINKTDIIHGWTETDYQKVKEQVHAWTTKTIFDQNPYLIEEVRHHTRNVI